MVLRASSRAAAAHVVFDSTADEALAVHFVAQCCAFRWAEVHEKKPTWGNGARVRRKPCRNAALRQKVHIPGRIRR